MERVCGCSVILVDVPLLVDVVSTKTDERRELLDGTGGTQSAI